MASCDDFLNQNPDPRVDWKIEDQISLLLVSAYSTADYAAMCELSSDNIIDNHSPDENGDNFLFSSAYRFHDEAFAWQAITDSRQDATSDLWEKFYRAIAVCNHALDEMDKMETKDTTLNLSAQRGEALVSRAYHHFILVNLFCQTYKDENQTDLGIPYITWPENTVLEKYDRETVPVIYRKIETDLLAGIDLINDTKYKQPKYRFNKAAANSFAARFFLYKREWEKVIKYADVALGEVPKFRNWYGSFPNSESLVYWYIDHTSSNNYLLMASNSTAMRIYVGRYGVARAAEKEVFSASGPSGNMSAAFRGKLYFFQNQDAGIILGPSAIELFEYSDKFAGIGWAHKVRPEFTAEQTILDRAEAKAHLGLLDDAYADFYIYEDARHDKTPTVQNPNPILRQFQEQIQNAPSKPLNNEKISSSWIITPEIEPYIQCVLFYRRLETIHYGNRWFDLKRYGIEIEHVVGRAARREFLRWDDERRAFQIPIEVLSAEMEPNPRPPTLNEVK